MKEVTVRETINDAKLLCNRESWQSAEILLLNARSATKVESYEIFVLTGWINWKKGGRTNKGIAAMFWDDVIKNGKEIVTRVIRASAYYGLGIYYEENGYHEKSLEHIKLARSLCPRISAESIFVEIEEKEE